MRPSGTQRDLDFKQKMKFDRLTGFHWVSTGSPLGFHWVSTGSPRGLHAGSVGVGVRGEAAGGAGLPELERLVIFHPQSLPNRRVGGGGNGWAGEGRGSGSK